MILLAATLRAWLAPVIVRNNPCVVVVGMMTHMCIDSTVRAAFDFDFTVELVGEACATYDQDYNGIQLPAEIIHATFLAALDGTFATVRSVADVTT